MQVKTNLFAKDMRVISDKYRKGYEGTFCTKKKDCKCFDCRFERKFMSK